MHYYWKYALLYLLYLLKLVSESQYILTNVYLQVHISENMHYW